MIVKMYCIYDRKTKLYHPPMFCHNDSHARRVFQTLFNKENVFNEYPADFEVVEVGMFNDTDGKIESTIAPIMVFEGEDLIRKETIN